jgi:cytochrome c
MSEEHHESSGAGMYWFQICGGLTAAAILIIGAVWATGILFPPPPNQATAYEIDYPDRALAEARAQNVNLAAVQVTWPFGMSDVRKRELLAHNRDLLKSNPAELKKVSYVDGPASVRSAPAAPVIEVPFPNLLAEADLGRGQVVAKKCLSCHTFNNGGRDSTGPNLWNVVGDTRARNANFKYSSAMAEFGGSWTMESLDEYLRKPGKFVKGTRMAFAGIRKAADRANLIAYMRSQSDSPVPLPDVVDVAPAEEAPLEVPAEAAEEAAAEAPAAQETDS